jgi:hypothetical protein
MHAIYIPQTCTSLHICRACIILFFRPQQVRSEAAGGALQPPGMEARIVDLINKAKLESKLKGKLKHLDQVRSLSRTSSSHSFRLCPPAPPSPGVCCLLSVVYCVLSSVFCLLTPYSRLNF